MSTPEGPGQPWENYPPPNDQQYPQQQYPQQQYPPQQYGPTGYQQPPGPDQPPPYGYQPQFGNQQQYGNPQHGYQPQYGYPPTRPSNRTPLIVATAGLVVIALVIVGIVVLSKDDDKKKDAQTPPPTTGPSSSAAPSSAAPSSAAPTSASATSSPSPSGSLSPTTVKEITVTPVVPGWHGVLSYRENVAYDVPPDWKVETPGTLVGFEDRGGNPVAIMHGVSTYKDEACPKVSGSYRGRTGFKTNATPDPSAAARNGLKIFAKGVALNDDGSSAPISGTTVEDVKVDGGKIGAKYARATVKLDDKSGCSSPSVVVVAVAFRTGSNATALFIGYFDQGVSGALSLTTAKKIFATLRPYKR